MEDAMENQPKKLEFGNPEHIAKVKVLNSKNGLKPPETFGQAIRNIIDIIKILTDNNTKFNLDESLFNHINDEITFLNNYVSLTPCEAVFFSIIANDENITLNNISDVLELRRIEVLEQFSSIESLFAKHLIEKSSGNRYRSGRSDSYAIPGSVRDAISKNEKIKIKNNKISSLDDFFDEIGNLFRAITNPYGDSLAVEDFRKELEFLVTSGKHLHFVKQLKKYNLNDFEDIEHTEVNETIIFLQMCNLLVNQNMKTVQISELELQDLCESRSYGRRIEKNLEKNLPVVFEGLIEYYCKPDGIGDRDTLTLTKKCKEEFLSEINLVEKENEFAKKHLTKSLKIQAKELFYNDKEERQVKELSALLQKDNFANICGKLKSKGMRAGFACLFYGAPGTGKTESVYQIAKQTERDIMLVDIAKMKSMWYGESEKIIKNLFDNYRSIAANSENAPILFFNEADAIINSRKEGNVNGGSIDKTENAIQNIILQEMETLEGILIATTNLAVNLDKAFERRFLYKIEFTKPQLQARALIWKSIIKELDENSARILAEKFDFSGGQIENIARRYAVDSILSDSSAGIEKIIRFCEEETLLKNDKAAKIGFFR